MQFIHTRRFVVTLVALGGFLAMTPFALAQQQEVMLTVTTEGLREVTESTEMYLSDPTYSFILVPPVGELMPPSADVPGEEGLDATGESAVETGRPGIGVESLFEVSSHQKSFVLGPYYRFGKRVWLKARLPIIFERTMTYFDAKPSASGLGDLSLQVDYAWPMHANTHLRTRLDVAVPTGDSEKTDGQYLVPLGTGAWGFSLGGQYSRQTSRSGYLANLAVRMNTANSVTVQYVNASAVLATITNDITNAPSLALSLFGWRSLTPKLAVHVGASMLAVGDGETKFSRQDAAGPATAGSYGNGQSMVVLDLYPGVTYKLGPLNPFLGVRVPVVSSYDVERDREDRDLAVILQFTYQPGRMRHEEGE
jgi:hypothetical protein